MEALHGALGPRLAFSVAAPDGMIRRQRRGARNVDTPVEPEPWWAALLRRASGMKT